MTAEAGQTTPRLKSGEGSANPNLCEDCIGRDRPEEAFDLADTGVCGACGTIGEVWDLDHLKSLKARGAKIYEDTTRIIRPIRDSHMSPHGSPV